MVARGRVQNGVVVLDESVRLVEGQEVIVLDAGTPPTASSSLRSSPHSVLDIPVVSLGPMLPAPSDDDLLREMLDGRR